MTTGYLQTGEEAILASELTVPAIRQHLDRKSQEYRLQAWAEKLVCEERVATLIGQVEGRYSFEIPDGLNLPAGTKIKLTIVKDG